MNNTSLRVSDYSEPAAARVFAERFSQSGRLDPGLELNHSLVVSPRFPVHGILQTLNQTLQMRDALLKKTKYFIVRNRLG